MVEKVAHIVCVPSHPLVQALISCQDLGDQNSGERGGVPQANFRSDRRSVQSRGVRREDRESLGKGRERRRRWWAALGGEEGRGAVAGPLPAFAARLPSPAGRAPDRFPPRPGRFRGRRQLVAAPGPRRSSNRDPGSGADAAWACAEVRGWARRVRPRRGARPEAGSFQGPLAAGLGAPPLPAPAARPPR